MFCRKRYTTGPPVSTHTYKFHSCHTQVSAQQTANAAPQACFAILCGAGCLQLPYRTKVFTPIPYYFQSIVIFFWGTGQNESKLFLLLRYFLEFTAFYLVIFDFTPLPPILPRYLEKVRCEPEGQFDIVHSKRDGT